jgi:hypothetical protein
VKNSLLLYSLFIIISSSFGQTTDTSGIIPANIRIAYNSSLIYPGATASIDMYVQNIELTKINTDGEYKKILKSRFVSLSIGFYHHKGFHDNLYILPEWIMRRSKSGPWFTEFTAGLGYSRTFLGGTTYKVDENGDVSIVPLAGYSYVLAAAGFGLGYDYSVSRKKPFSVYSRLNLLVMFPYNSTFYPRPTLEIGIIYKPAHLLERKINLIHKKKSNQK